MAKKKEGPTLKGGRITKEEREFILGNARVLSPAEIGRRLGRAPDKVQTFQEENLPLYEQERREAGEDVVQKDIRQDLKKSQAWQRLKQELLADELKYFEEQYVKLKAAFREEMTAADETQLFQTIKLDIVLAGKMSARASILRNRERTESILNELMDAYDGRLHNMEPEDREHYVKLQDQLTLLRADEKVITDEIPKLQAQCNRLFESLKATREQRLKTVEAVGTNFLSVIKDLEKRERQEQEGRLMELMRVAGEREYNRLGTLHEYSDGTVDRPILSADTVDLMEEPPAEPADGQTE